MRTPKANPFDWSEMTQEEINSKLYEIELTPVYYYPNGYSPYQQPAQHREAMVVIDKNSRRIVSDRTVSRNYQPIQTRDALNFTQQQLLEANIEHKVTRIDNHGAYQSVLISLPGQVIEPKVGDIIEQYFMLNTAHNGLKDLSLAHFTKRLWCLNGATTNSKDFSLSILHKGDTNRRIQDGLNLYLEGCIKSVLDLYEFLGNTRIAYNRFEQWLDMQDILQGEYYKEQIREQVREHTMFDVYQAFTNLITHSYGRSVNAKLNKYNQLNKDVSKWNKLFGIELTMIPVKSYEMREETVYEF